MGRLLVFCSGKGGVGKSTVAAGVSIAAAEAGRKTLLVDTDAGLRCLDLMLNVSDRLVFDLYDVIGKGRDPKDAVIEVDTDGRLSLIAAPARKCDLDPVRLVGFLTGMAAEYDLVVMDCPAGIDRELFGCLPESAGIFVVVNSDKIALRDAYFLQNELSGTFGDSVYMLINRFSARAVRRGLAAGIDDAINSAGIRLAGIVPEDKAALNLYSVRYTKSRMAAACRRIFKRIEGEQVPLPELRKI